MGGGTKGAQHLHSQQPRYPQRFYHQPVATDYQNIGSKHNFNSRNLEHQSSYKHESKEPYFTFPWLPATDYQERPYTVNTPNNNIRASYQQFSSSNYQSEINTASSIMQGFHSGPPPVQIYPQYLPYPMDYYPVDHYNPSAYPYVSATTESHNLGNISPYGSPTVRVNTTHSNGFTGGYFCPIVPPPIICKQVPPNFGQENVDPNMETCSVDIQVDNSHAVKQKSRDDHKNYIKKIALSFVHDKCPSLGDRPFCLPPIKRIRDLDKSSKQLVMGLECEQRVLSSFERYFAEAGVPVFMLCNYPLTGFMQVYQGRGLTSSNEKGTVTLLLFSHVFAVTIVTVGIINSNSDFAYIQKGVQKVANHMKKTSAVVSQWLTFLGVNPEVKQVIAFPNLKRDIMRRISKDKQFQKKCGSLCTLHIDDLPAPFQTEWSSDKLKNIFINWMEQKVLSHGPTLSREEVQLVVGAFLSPRLSMVDFVPKEGITPIPETPSYSEIEKTADDVSQLKITIDGTTESFDKFMKDYLENYFPHLETQSYRVPPLHFNIQSTKKFVDLLEILKKDSSDGKACLPLLKNVDLGDREDELNQLQEIRQNEQFMPRAHIAAYRGSNFAGGNVGPWMEKCSTVVLCNQQTLHKGTDSSDSLPPINIPLEKTLQNAEVLLDVMTKDLRADEGENRVISAIESLGYQYGPMFIICGYQYNNYLNKLKEEMFSKEQAIRPIRAFGQIMRAEHDCLIFHKKYGVIIVCIKAIGDNFDEWGATWQQRIASTRNILEKAINQLKREETLIKHVTSDLTRNLAFHKLIALPNMKRENVKEALEADATLKQTVQETFGHDADLFLCSDELPPKFTTLWNCEGQDFQKLLNDWWQNFENFLSNRENSEIESNLYRQLIGRYCGLYSTVEVWSESSPRVEVRSTSQAVKLCAERFHKLVLLPCQIKALYSNESRVFLCGPPGSGKTLLLTLKANQWLLAGETVTIVNARTGSRYGYPYAYGVYKRLEQMMKKSKIPSHKLRIIHTDSLDWQSTEFINILPSACIIMDEVSAAAHDLIEHLSSLHVQMIWCAGIFADEKPITAQPFSTYKMERILRCPPVIQSILKYTESSVRTMSPYKDCYLLTVVKESFVPEQKNSFSDSSKDSGTRNKQNKSQLEILNVPQKIESLNYDPDSLNQRLEHKYVAGHIRCEIEQNTYAGYVVKYESQEEIHSGDKKQGYDASEKDEVDMSEQEQLNKRLIEKYGDNFRFRYESQQSSDLSNTKLSSNTGETYKSKPGSLHAKSPEILPVSDNGLADNDKEHVTSADQNVETEIIDPKEKQPEQEQQYSGSSFGIHNNFQRSDKFMLVRMKYHFGETDNIQESVNETMKQTYGNDKSQNTNQQDKGLAINNSVNPQHICRMVNKLTLIVPIHSKYKENENMAFEANEEIMPIININERLMKKYSGDSDSNSVHNYNSSSTQAGLATDGPRPFIIDHSHHSRSGPPNGCSECGDKLAEILKSMVKPVDASVSANKNQQIYGKSESAEVMSRKNMSQKLGSSIIYSNTSASPKKSLRVSSVQKLDASFESKDLNWSDVLIVAGDMNNNGDFVNALRHQQIPVEVLFMSDKTSEIGVNPSEKLYITSYREVTGLEKALIVFIPSFQNELNPPIDKSIIHDIHLRRAIDRYTDEDKRILWFVASRSLASLVLILP